MLKCHATCAHPTLLICCTLRGVGTCPDWLVMFSVIVCASAYPLSVCFVTAVLIKGPSKAFLCSQMMALLKRDYPGVAKALLQIRHFTTLNKIAKSFLHSVRICSLLSWFFQSNNLSQVFSPQSFTLQVLLCDFHLCPKQVKVSSTKVSGWKYKTPLAPSLPFSFFLPFFLPFFLSFWGKISGAKFWFIKAWGQDQCTERTAVRNDFLNRNLGLFNL